MTDHPGLDEALTFDEVLPWACGYSENRAQPHYREVKALVERIIALQRGEDKLRADRDRLSAGLRAMARRSVDYKKGSRWHMRRMMKAQDAIRDIGAAAGVPRSLGIAPPGTSGQVDRIVAAVLAARSQAATNRADAAELSTLRAELAKAEILVGVLEGQLSALRDGQVPGATGDVPELWWSPSKAKETTDLIGGLSYRYVSGTGFETPTNLRPDAVRLVAGPGHAPERGERELYAYRCTCGHDKALHGDRPEYAGACWECRNDRSCGKFTAETEVAAPPVASLACDHTAHEQWPGQSVRMGRSVSDGITRYERCEQLDAPVDELGGSGP